MMLSSRSTYSVTDFVEWESSKSLVISPKFQRREIWTSAAKSFLIDTLLRGYPVPPIYIRVRQSDDKKKTIREVIDGQQRISAILSFKTDAFALSKNVSSEQRGRRFSDLTPELQDSIDRYGFICEVFQGIGDAQVLEIFRRVNTYSVPLNSQELRNGRFFGAFKELSYDLGAKYLEFWRINKILSEQKIARMAEAELTSELLILILDGPQDKKSSIDKFYAQFENSFPEKTKSAAAFRTVVDTIADSCGDILAASAFKRTPLFYALFGAVSHRLFRVKGIAVPLRKTGALSPAERTSLHDAVSSLSELIDRGSAGEKLTEAENRFFVACQRQTDNLKPRVIRIEEVARTAFS